LAILTAAGVAFTWTAPPPSAIIDVMSTPQQQDEARTNVEWRALRDLAPHL